MIEELKKESLEVLKENKLLTKEYVEKELKANPFAHFLLYIENSQVIGYLYYSDIYERAELNQLEIDVIHRSCGKGAKLLKKFIDIIKKDITLEVRADNDIAIHLYKKFNFVEKAIRKNYYGSINGILMERKV